ncbi:MAG: tripartite tricarboxylate transporter substrate binding protein [Pseudomonadota bacterium]
MEMSHGFRHFAGLVLAAVAGSALAASGSYPNAPITMVVPVSAGASADTITRILTVEMSALLGQSIVIDNRAGANAIIGTNVVAHARPDGYTLLSATGSHAINAILYKKLPYAAKDFRPVAIIGVTDAHVVVVKPGSPYTSVRQLVDAAKAPDSRISYGSGGVGNPTHLVGEYFRMLTHTKLLHVPYKGGAPAINALMAGDVTFLFANPVGVMEQIRQGLLKPIAVTGKQRLPQLPDVPTMAEAGFPEYSLSAGWQGIFAPRATPPEAVKKLNEAVNTALKNDKVRQRLIDLGLVPVGGTPADLDALMQRDMAQYGDVIRRAQVLPPED